MTQLKRIYPQSVALLGLILLSAIATARQPCSTIDVYVSVGCPHCAAAQSYLGLLQQRAGLTITIKHLEDASARREFVALNQARDVPRPGVPTLLVCDQLLIGFDPVNSPGQIEHLLAGGETRPDATVDLPLFGRIAPDELSLPLFTIAVGLVDGFNPCAMWVLLFLLSVLVNIRRRSRIILIAGTFVIVSGLVYFAFMAAWLSAFLLIGLSRPLQLGLGLLALLVGIIHIKDFFALHQGVSLSIPERSKPGLYARVRGIVRAESLLPALFGAVALATVVNLIELLCTAGLPALYTQVLTLQQLPSWQYYAYLVLYNVAYMLDDALMVTVAVATLGHHKLQQRQGRWLKLISGSVIVVLGLLLLAAPQALIF